MPCSLNGKKNQKQEKTTEIYLNSCKYANIFNASSINLSAWLVNADNRKSLFINMEKLETNKHGKISKELLDKLNLI